MGGGSARGAERTTGKGLDGVGDGVALCDVLKAVLLSLSRRVGPAGR